MTQLLTVFLERLWRCVPLLLVWLASFLCACSTTGSAATSSRTAMLPPLDLSHHIVREVCWEPSEVGEVNRNNDANSDDNYFVLAKDGTAIPSKKRSAFIWGLEPGGFVYKYNLFAPIENLRLLPLSRAAEAWCTGIPKPTDPAVRRLLDPCAIAASMPDGRSVAKNVLGQTDGVAVRSPLFCGKLPQVAPTTQEMILLLNRNEAFQQAYIYAHKTAMALTLAEAQMQAVINNSDSWLKKKFTGDPGSVEQIQQRVADALNSIEPPPEYGDPILDGLALAGMNAGFDNGKFEVEAKLFAIEAGIVIIEVVAMEVALGPLGGAKFLASAVSKGTKALGVAASRLENIPIFLPIANGGAGASVTIGTLINAVRRGASAKLANALIADGIKRPGGTDAHHMVALGHRLAAESRKILADFGIKLDNAVNGVFLPSNMKSPNPTNAIVHATLANNHKYYNKVHAALKQAKSQREVIEILGRIRKTLLDGTFYDAILYVPAK